MTQTTERQADQMVQELLAKTLGEHDDISVNDLVHQLVAAGLRREQAVALLHRQIASGEVILTDSFMVTRSA